MAHTLVTGIQGRVHVAGSAYANTGVWNIDPSDAVLKKITSATRGAAVRLKGNEDWSGSFVANGTLPTVLPGDQFVFEGVISGDGGIGAADFVVQGTARCSELVVTVNFVSGEPISHAVSFQSDGTLTYTENTQVELAGALDADAFVVPVGAVQKVTYTAMPAAPGSIDTVLPDVQTVTITLTSNNVPRITSSTAGVVLHDRGTPDATVSIAVLEASPLLWWKNGAVFALKVHVTGSTDWEFQFLYVEKLSNVQVDPDSNEIVGVTYEMGFCSVAATDTANTPGVIIAPSGSDWYPYA